jgi:PII-like signaling protein
VQRGMQFAAGRCTGTGVHMATGSQLTLYASRSLKKGHQYAVDWILDAAKAAGVRGATVMEACEGIDVQGRLHAARFFELADEPAMVVIVADDAAIDALLATLEQGGIKLFYTRTPLEFGHLGGD